MFKIGNVIRLKDGYLAIVTNVNDKTTEFVSFSSSNSSGVINNKTYETVENCFYCEEDYDCEVCNNTGKVTQIFYGVDEAKLEANCVKDFIVSRMLKNFEL